jgi:hypothetical protein
MPQEPYYPGAGRREVVSNLTLQSRLGHDAIVPRLSVSTRWRAPRRVQHHLAMVPRNGDVTSKLTRRHAVTYDTHALLVTGQVWRKVRDVFVRHILNPSMRSPLFGSPCSFLFGERPDRPTTGDHCGRAGGRPRDRLAAHSKLQWQGSEGARNSSKTSD